MHALQYQPPNGSDNRLHHIMHVVQDPYALGLRLIDPEQSGPPYPCYHSAIYAVSLHPELGIAQFTNPEGLALPLVLLDSERSAFEREMMRAYGRELGHLRGSGQFAICPEDFGGGQALLRQSRNGKPLLGGWAGFVTYYLSPPTDRIRWLQDGPPDEEPTAQSITEWRAMCDERDAIREWLQGPQP